ncbi:MAG: DUF4198 domain-containing protein [Marinibacterium sp.]
MFRKSLGWFLALCMTATPSLGHEYWIDAKTYMVAPGSPIVANLRNGQKFVGSALPYLDRRTARFDVITGDRTQPAPGRTGDLPALIVPTDRPGLWIIAHETTPSLLTYREWDKFLAFAKHKDFPDIAARHLGRGLPETGFSESYTRHVKALFNVGDGAGHDIPTGMETEFVALANPYTDDLSKGLPVQVFYQGTPRGEAQVEIFDRAADGTVTVTTTRTDADGIATIPVASGHSYLLDAVVLRPAPESDDAVWETLWAALTFAVP